MNGGPLKLQMKRVIKASPAELFDAWTKPELMRKWFAPGDMTVPAAISDLRVGGAYRVEMQDGPDKIHVATGVYKQIVPGQLVSFTWVPNCGEERGGKYARYNRAQSRCRRH